MTLHRLSWLSRPVLGAAILAIAACRFSGLELREDLSAAPGLITGVYFVTINLAMLACPRFRKADLASHLVLLAACLELLVLLAHGRPSIVNILAAALGAYGALAPSWIERLRTLMRQAPDDPIRTAWRRHDRRSKTLKRKSRPDQPNLAEVLQRRTGSTASLNDIKPISGADLAEACQPDSHGAGWGARA